MYTLKNKTDWQLLSGTKNTITTVKIGNNGSSLSSFYLQKNAST